MKTRHLTMIFALCATAAVAHAGVKDPIVKARMDLMGQIKDATGVLGGMAKNPGNYDAAKAAKARADLIDYSAKVSAAFETQADDPKSEASDMIWTKWDDFTAKADALTAAATALDPSSIDGVRAGMGGIGQSCGGCHKSYKLN